MVVPKIILELMDLFEMVWRKPRDAQAAKSHKIFNNYDLSQYKVIVMQDSKVSGL